MLVAIISDSHGNLTALDAVLEDLDRRGPYDEVLMGGDLAWGGPFPVECVERIRERGYRAVRGNTDQMIADAADGGDDPQARWTIEHLGQDNVAYLQGLPMRVDVDTGDPASTLALVHATPWSIYDTVRPGDTDDRFGEMLSSAGVPVLAYGHIHLQHQRAVDGGLVVAVGAIGLPFDGDQRAMYAVLELRDGTWSVDFRRVAYDVDRAVQQTLERGAPNASGFANSLRSAASPQ
jgi:predicted phosphodiesterase